VKAATNFPKKPIPFFELEHDEKIHEYNDEARHAETNEPPKTADKIDRGQAVEVKDNGPPRIFQRKERPERSPEDENKTPKEY